jgi:hypothetical protein
VIRRNAAWEAAISNEQRAWRDMRESQTGDAVRAWWATTETILLLWQRSVANGAESSTPLPPTLISALKMVAGDLAVGKTPQLIALARKEARTKLTPIERLPIIYAVLYVAAAKEGIQRDGKLMKIADGSPIKTVAEAFKVDRIPLVVTNIPRGWSEPTPKRIQYGTRLCKGSCSRRLSRACCPDGAAPAGIVGRAVGPLQKVFFD